MAFNPFHSFRKHQKVIFAVLTIMCMLVFVLQFGRGDMFERMAGLFGSSRGKGDVVATLYGKKVTTGELTGPNGLRGQRVMASDFVEAARQSMIEVVVSDPRAQSDKIDSRLRMALQFLSQPPEFIRQLPQNSLFQQMFGAQQGLQSYQDELKIKEGKEDERKFAEEVAEALKIQQSLIFMRAPGAYFGATYTTADLLDFKLWEHQADKLGIVLTEGALRVLVMKETGGRDLLPERSFKPTDKSKLALANFYKRYANIPESQIVNAVAAEYRVIFAQEALLGQAERYQGANSREDRSPVNITPGEFLQYFREQRTTVKVALLPIPVEDFEKSVPDPTNDAELLELYKQYKNKESSPSQPNPGFMEPRSVRVQYLIANAKSDFYQNLAKKFFVPSTALTDVQLALKRQLQASIGAASMGGGPGTWLSVAAPLASDPVLQQYNSYSEDRKKGLEKGHNVAPDIYDPSYDAASALGHILSGLAQGNPGAAPMAIHNTKQAHALTQARAAGAAILAGTSPTPVSATILHALTEYVQPMDKIDAYLVEQTRTKLAKQLVAWKLIEFFHQLDKLRSSPKEAEAFVEKTAKEDDFRLETMKTAKDSQHLTDDPTLKDLVSEFAKRTPTPIKKPVEIASELMKTTGLFQVDLVRGPTGADPSAFPDEWSLYWLVEDNPAKIRTFAAARPDVIKAWKRLQAHKLAIKMARKIEAKAQEQKWPTDSTARKDAVEAFLKQQNFGQPFVLEKIARQVEKDSSNPGLSKLYEPYTPPEDALKYPPEKFTDQVLNLTKPGDATWLQDRPETTLYVAVLLERTEPKYDDFLRAYQNSLSDSLWTNYVSQERQNFKTKFLENMRTEAAPGDTDNGKWKLPANLQKQSPVDDAE